MAISLRATTTHHVIAKLASDLPQAAAIRGGPARISLPRPVSLFVPCLEFRAFHTASFLAHPGFGYWQLELGSCLCLVSWNLFIRFCFEFRYSCFVLSLVFVHWNLGLVCCLYLEI